MCLHLSSQMDISTQCMSMHVFAWISPLNACLCMAISRPCMYFDCNIIMVKELGLQLMKPI
jgi:hypothetical protein